MKSTLVTKRALMLLCALSGLMFASMLAAQTVNPAHPAGSGRFLTYNQANELALNGTVQQLITTRQIGSPPGMHLLIAGPHGTVDAHLGPFLAKDLQTSLHAGASVKVIGVIKQMRGQQYILARQLEFNGRIVNIRSSNGFLLRTIPTRSSRVAAGNSAQNGGR